MSTVDMDALLRRLHLANARRIWKSLCARAEAEEWTYQQLLETLISEEIAHRKGTRLGRVVRRAGFPFLKTIDDFDFTFQSTLRPTSLRIVGALFLCPMSSSNIKLRECRSSKPCDPSPGSFAKPSAPSSGWVSQNLVTPAA